MRRTEDEEWGIPDLPIKKVSIGVKFNADVLRMVKRVLAWVKKVLK